MTKTTAAASKLAPCVELILGLVVVGVVTLWVSAAHAESTERQPLLTPVLVDDGPGMLIPVIVKTAELTDEQDAAVTKLMEKENAPILKLLKALQRASVELAEKTFEAESPRPTETAPLLRRISEIRGQLMQREMATLLRIRALLKPEQLANIEKVNAAVMHDFRRPGSSPFDPATPID
jgi:hypothetical protein